MGVYAQAISPVVLDHRRLPLRVRYMSSSEDVITQVAPPGASSDIVSVHELPETTMLNLRGTTFAVSRERLLSLPENILFGLTSGTTAYSYSSDELESHDDDAASGVAATATPLDAADQKDSQHIHRETEELPPLTSQSQGYESVAANDSIESVEEGETDTEAMHVDFNQDCFAYLLSTFDECEQGVTPVPITAFKEFRDMHDPDEHDADGGSADGMGGPESPALFASNPFDVPEVLRSRPAVIVLREDLEYYLLTKPGLLKDEVIALKERAGETLASAGSNRQIFSGLRNRNILDSPEYHLMQMLVLAGLATSQPWGFREHEPRQARVLSLQLQHVSIPTDKSMIENVRALQKLLLFWRKPAKKCWWDKFDLELAAEPGSEAPTTITMHARRVWTLELSILGLAT